MRKAIVILTVMGFAMALAMPAMAQVGPQAILAYEAVGLVDCSARATVAEIEPNGTELTASGPLTGGDVGTGNISVGGPSGDLDYWAININAIGTWSIGTDAGAAPAVGDTYINLYLPSGYVSNDNGGPGNYSLITWYFTVPGTYYLRVRSSASSYKGNYVLTVVSPLPPPPNDTCAGAIPLPLVPAYSVSTSTAGALNDYTLTAAGCTGDTADDADIVYSVTLEAEQEITLVWTPIDFFYATLYVVTNCADAQGSCVAGEAVGTGAQTVHFQNTTGVATTYYIICDSYRGSGAATLTIQAVVPTEAQSWGATKSLYR